VPRIAIATLVHYCHELIDPKFYSYAHFNIILIIIGIS
jgi:hypothetical protein